MDVLVTFALSLVFLRIYRASIFTRHTSLASVHQTADNSVPIVCFQLIIITAIKSGWGWDDMSFIQQWVFCCFFLFVDLPAFLDVSQSWGNSLVAQLKSHRVIITPSGHKWELNQVLIQFY